MSNAWVLIVSIIIVMVLYGYISSKITERKKSRIRGETVPAITDALCLGIAYDVHLSDGRVFDNVEIVGSVENDDDAFSFAGYDGMVVLRKVSGKRVFLKKTSIRFVTEI